ncbi:MAG: hypothetical protein A2Y24_06220 [Clostridiales bacterium GWE2_32_10]|nr:MAG: hypothetical protein A2Y24_06220 [Clostridiales bacterium GWE2_32_10]HBY21642.1 hypothetical protein [Clostridiales bacterium]
MSERKLASIQKILDIQPIEGSDNIESCTIQGWHVIIAKKDNFKIGDLVVYFEIDSLLDQNNPIFEFMRPRKFKVKTLKMRGTISQGLVMPLSILPKGEWTEGQDITALTKTKKYDPQAEQEQRLLNERITRNNNKIHKFFSRYKWYRNLFFISKKKTGFPAFIKKTDEERIQNIPDILNLEKDTNFIVTEKLDGQSATFYLIKNKTLSKLWKPYIFGVCSRNLELTKPDSSSYWTIAKQYNIEDVLKTLILDNQYIVLQGEIIGSRIQNNKYKVKGYDFYAFNLMLPDKQINSINAQKTLSDLGIKFVPILDENFKLKSTVDDMVEYAKGKSKLYLINREGVVIRNNTKNISFKVINSDFLLENDE